MIVSRRNARGEAMTPAAWSSPAIADIESPGWTVTTTSRPGEPRGWTCRANQTAPTIATTIAPAITRRNTPPSKKPRGLHATARVQVALEKQGRRGRVAARAALARAVSGVGERARRGHGAESLVDLEQGDVDELALQVGEEAVGGPRRLGHPPREGDGSPDEDEGNQHPKHRSPAAGRPRGLALASRPPAGARRSEP